ncbi:MAG: SDR family oxidoreductase [Chlorobium sp.]|uniref:SDR family oxidoreductase n=1 Tax=Chlorobium sp. TaxID=1095 RepID=UPI0025BAC088|nr:SDR family oxidoreductase [Chlorobium sp.]MCF8383592.1 SDR family oxidoreductase [Chlorobium sp.]
MAKQKVLVAGASGYLGRHVVREFAARGYSVRSLVRSQEKLACEGPNLEPPIAEFVEDIFIGDAVDRASLKEACKGMDIVFSCMGLTKPLHNITSQQVDHLGNKALLEDAISHSVRKFIYISVFNSYRMMDSDMVKAHELFVQDLRDSGMPYTIIRPTAYFNDMGMFFSFARKGHVFLFGDGKNRFNPIHGADLARVCVDAAENKTNSEIAIGGPDIFTYDETNIMAFEALGMEPKITHVPMWVGDIALFVIGIVNKPLKSIMSFALSVSRMDNVAPATGTKHLKDFFRELAAKSG